MTGLGRHDRHRRAGVPVGLWPIPAAARDSRSLILHCPNRATMTGTGVQPPLTYCGGKTRLASRIAALPQPHEHYVEPYTGSLAVLLAESRRDSPGRRICASASNRAIRSRP